MRVFFDHQAFSLQSHGGITTVFSELFRHLASEADISVDLFLGRSATHFPFSAICTEKDRVIEVGRRWATPGARSYIINEALTIALAPMYGKYDIYHSTLYRFIPAIRARYKIATHHDCVQEVFPELFPDAQRNFRFRSRMYRLADVIICVSEASRQDLLKFYDVDPSATVVVHNGILPMKIEAEGQEALELTASGTYVLYVGARHSYKNFPAFLRACAESGITCDYSILVVGGGEAKPSESELVAKLGLSRRLRFVPYASRSLLAAVYANASLLVYPSLYEGFGMPPLEAASVGCVSLVAKNPASLEVCQDGVFYFDPYVAGDFERMLQASLTDTLGRSARIEKARNLVQQYTWERCCRQIVAVYRGLCTS